MSRVSTPCQRLLKVIMRRPSKRVAGLLLLLLAGHVATLTYAYHQQGQSDLLRGIAALCSVLALPPLALLLPAGSSLMSWAWLAVHVTYSNNLARGALRVLNDLQAQPLLHALGMGHPDALDTIAYWWWFLQGLLLPTLASLVSGPSAPYDDNPDDDDTDDNNPDCDSADDDNPDRDLDPAGEEDDFAEMNLREAVVVVEAVDWQFRVGALVPPPDSPLLQPRGEEEMEDEDEFENVDRMEVAEAVEEGLFGVGVLAAPPEPPAEEEGEEEDGIEEVERGEVVGEVVEGQLGVEVVAAPPDLPARHPGPVE
ncbi:uncharacterized protein LOC126991116 [Eriocheir sinensis]|uniref:uncharacterized protein LOC126991116 n=1 Tax=Eriocheir sinensis TaxID=95602 RepID=UPI0021CA94EF|nr:uncharacterized protein LOC126991116 [Eriocheir sinensis]XP_050705775.1 uncharacterized protein LOC126991116 [Eriocheir sinensis]XP_050705776.1 uncharacterized protein LOC126991116 [Eriocheir sinensis]XP_050705777.1 uncharacterized protein LOC126991116 [Eriocheir sinensis]XP_050705778.1 uncharacterized protein LOC126991116 [Eriocheir sinensis]XP_050705779.1 uncharacterized protein LOC126991116 [Eriocheir sinensis]XP_050705781.1 uncharacterized protein LOC126991116 [Eriocheir sinensis]XP_0